MSTGIQTWNDAPKGVIQRGIDESTWNALKSTIYPGAKDASIILAVDYCRARKLDPMLKPVHLVPMQVTVKHEGRQDTKEWRDVPMPGIGLYRIQAARSGDYAGADEPEFGPEVTRDFTGYDQKIVTCSFPQWCKFTVRKLIGDRIVEFSAKEYWLENYASLARDKDAPNSMWAKRPYAQLAKCAEAQALRRAWPEIGSDPTAEEMAGKTLDADEIRDVTPEKKATPTVRQANQQVSAAKDEPLEGEVIEQAEPKQDAPTQDAAPAASEPADGPAIKANHVKMIKTKLERFGDNGSTLLTQLQVDCVESIPLARLNDAMDYVNKLGKSE